MSNHLCHVQTTQDIPKIWADIAHLNTKKDRTALEISCFKKAQDLRLKAPKITHTTAILLLRLESHTKYPGRMSDAMNIFMFLDFHLAAGTETVLVSQWWDT